MRLSKSVLILLLLAPPLAAQSSSDPTDLIPGVALASGYGNTESVGVIMERERLSFTRIPDVIKIKSEFPVPPKIGSNPDAPAVSQWPPAPAEATPQPVNPQTVGVNFLAINLLESGFSVPDTTGDVGPTQILVGTNGRIRVFDKLGNLGPLNTTLNSFFASVGGEANQAIQPHIRFDRLSGRWFVCAISASTPTNEILIAVSSGSAITGGSSFTFFSFAGAVAPAEFTDYPTLGVDRFALYIGVNEWDMTPVTFIRTSAFVINKANLLAPTPTLTVTAFRDLDNAGIWAPQGVHNDDPAATEGYFTGVDFNFFSRLGILRVTDPGGPAPTISAQMNVNVPTTTFPIDQVQPAAGPPLDSIDDRLFAAQIHTNKITGARTLWTSHNIEVNSSGAGMTGGGRNGSRWYEIGSLTTTPSLIQAGTLFDPAASTPFGFWIPSVAMSGQGHMAIGTSRASANSSGGHASVAVAGRLRSDTIGTLRTPTVAQGSTFVYNVGPGTNRWGDYSQTVVDPNDDQTMWTFQEYANSTNSWGVRVTQLIAPPPATPSSARAPVPTGQPSVSVVIEGISSAGSEFFDPGPDTGGPGFANRLSATVTGGVTVNSATFLSPTHVRLDVSTVSAAPGIQTVKMINPDGQFRSAAILRVGSCDPVELNPSSLANARQGVAYSQTFTQTGSSVPVTFTQSGSLPAGLTFTPSTATLSGIPTQSGTFPINITVSDTTGCNRTRKYSLLVINSSGMAATALSVDAAGNNVFETGDPSPTLAPSWFNDSSFPQTFGGSISNWGGPLGTGTVYTIADSIADYGTVANGETGSCIATGNCYAITATTSTRPATHWDGTLLETLNPPALGDKTWTIHVGNSFTDVPSSHLFYRFIETLLHHGVTGGCGADTYCPSNSVLRSQMAVFLLRAKEGASYAPPPYTGIFSDVPNDFFGPFIEELSRRGITGGCTASMYCPGSNVTRAQMAVFIIRAVEGTAYTPPPWTGMFDDVPNDFFGPYIEEMARRGITSGCSASPPLYCPGNPVTRGQMAVFLSRSLNLGLYAP